MMKATLNSIWMMTLSTAEMATIEVATAEVATTKSLIVKLVF